MSQTFGILLDLDRAFAFDRRAFSGIAGVANARGDVRLSWKLRGEEWRAACKAREVDAIIIARTDAEDRALLGQLRLPFVCLADVESMPDNGYVVANDEDAIGEMAARHFLEAGYRSYAAVCRPNVREYFANRLGAFARRVAAKGFACPIGPPGEPPRVGRATGRADGEGLWDVRADRWIQQLLRPAAIFAPYDAYAQVAVNACRNVRLRVPDDVSIIGVDDDDTYCLTTSPQLSSVVTPAKQIGEVAIELLLNVLSGKAPPSRRVLFPPTGIVVRGSSSERAMQDPDLLSAVRFIRENASRNIRVADIAAHVLLSRRTLERRFLAAVGHTLMDEVRRAKLSLAKRLLIDTDLSLSLVARKSGLIHQQRLNYLIKRDTGMTPMHLREAARAHTGDGSDRLAIPPATTSRVSR